MLAEPSRELHGPVLVLQISVFVFLKCESAVQTTRDEICCGGVFAGAFDMAAPLTLRAGIFAASAWAPLTSNARHTQITCPGHAPSRELVAAAGKLDFLLRMQICPTITFTFPSKKAAALAGAVSAHSAGVVLHSARLRNCASPGKFGVVVADFDVSL